MRSVVVVLPASICAMIPMLRTLASSTAVWVATCFFSSLSRRFAAMSYSSGGAACLRRPAFSPAVVGEGLVGFGHLVGVLAALHARPEAVARVEQLVHEPLGHGLLPARPRVRDQPAQRQGGAAGGTDLDRHLVGGAAHPAAADLKRRLDIVER